MFYKYILMLISCTLALCNTANCTFESTLEDLLPLSPEEQQQYFMSKTKAFLDIASEEEKELAYAIMEKDNAHAEHILNQHPMIDINKHSLCNIPMLLAMVFTSNNGYMLKVLINRGLDTTNLGIAFFYLSLLHSQFDLDIIEIVLQHGFLKQLTLEYQIVAFTKLLKIFNEYKYTVPQAKEDGLIQLALHNGFDIQGFKQYITSFYEDLAESFKDSGFINYVTYIAPRHSEQSDEQLQAIKEHYNCRDTQDLTFYANIMHMLKSKGLDLKTAPYKKHLTILANAGNTGFTKHLVLNNDSLSLSDLEEILTQCKNNQVALEKTESVICDGTDQEKAVNQATTEHVLHQWHTHKNKSVVKLLRRLIIITRLFNTLAPKEIAYKIAQYDSADFQDKKLALLPSYEQVREFIQQKKLEYAHFNTQNPNTNS